METATNTNNVVRFTANKLFWVSLGLLCCACITGFLPALHGLVNVNGEKPSVFVLGLTVFSYLFLASAIASSVFAIFWRLYRMIRYDEEIDFTI